ncbi:MAG: SH3-like domain-containing protein [Alphaproteobacteria bacterium]|jgi:SH3-like domain-containing protein
MRIFIILSLLFANVVLSGIDAPVLAAGETKKRAPSGLKLPRFVSLHSDEVNVRAGPGVRYPVKWVFVRRRLPVEITAEFETWRKVRDSSGAEGWVHRAMLSGRRSIVVVDKQTTMRRLPKAGSPAIARLDPGIVARIERCDLAWCSVETQGYDGWVRRDGVWGLYKDETPN